MAIEDSRTHRTPLLRRTSTEPEATASRREVVLGLGALGAAGAVPTFGTGNARGDASEWQWPGYRGAGQNGATQVAVPDALDNTLWSVGGGDQPATLPVFDDGTVFVGAGDQVQASDARTGRGGWAHSVPADVVGSPAVGETTVVVTLEDDSVAALDRENGSQRWRFGLSGTPGMPTVHGGTAYVGTHNGTVYAFDAESGDLKWSVRKHARRADDLLQRPTPVVTDGAVFVNMTDTFAPDPTLHALEPGTGEELWSVSLAGDTMYPPAVADDLLCVTVDEKVHVLSATNGSIQWKRRVPENGTPRVVAPAAVGNGTVAVVASTNFGEPHCYAYELDTGEERWSYQHDGTVPGGVAIAGEMVYFVVVTGGRSGDVVGVTLEDGLRRFERELGANPNDPPSPVPTPYGLAVPAGATVEFLGPEPSDPDADGGDGESSRTAAATESGGGAESGSESTSTASSSDAAAGSDGDGTVERGFLTNGGHDHPLLDVFYMTVLGFVLSVAGIVYQLREGE